MKLKKSLALVLGAPLMIGVFAGCGSEQAPKKDTIKFAAETTYPPFEFADGDKYQGFDVDLANAIGKETGKKVEFVSMGFDALIPALQSGQIDAIASGMVITKERLEKIDFSDPYYPVNLIMVVKKDNNTVNGEADIAGKTVAAQIGTTGAFLAKEKPGTTVKEFDTIPNMLQDLENGNVEIVMLDEPIAKYFIQVGNMANLKIVPVGLQSHQLGIGVAKNNPELTKEINAALKKMKDNGEYKKLEDKWFGNIK